MSLKSIRQLKIDNENKEEIQGVLERNPLLLKILECMVYLNRNPLVYYNGLKDINYYELYKLVQTKIRDIISPFLGTYLTIESEEDLYYELRFSDGYNSNSNLIKKMAEFYGESPEKFLERVNNERIRNNQVYLRFNIEFSNGKDRVFVNLFEILLDEIKVMVDNFLANFNVRCKEEDLNNYIKSGGKGIHLETLTFDYIEVEIVLPYFLFTPNIKVNGDNIEFY